MRGAGPDLEALRTSWPTIRTATEAPISSCRISASGPAGADGVVSAGHVAAGRLHLGAVGIGLLVDNLEITAQLGDELLTSRRPGTTPKVPGRKHIANDGLVLGLERSGLGADEGAV